MNELLVINRNGGTGETSLTKAFAALRKIDFLNGNMDVANLHHILTPEIDRQMDFQSGDTSELNIKKGLCVVCGRKRRRHRVKKLYKFSPEDVRVLL